MARKRKAPPQRIDESKRQCLTWNMSDLSADVTVVENNDPSLVKEQEDAEKSLKIKPAVSKDDIKREKQKVQKLIDDCDFYISVKKTFGLKEKEWSAKLGVIFVQCPETNTVEWLQSEILQQCSEIYLYINDDTGNHLLYAEGESNDNTASRRKESRPIAYFHVTSDTPAACFNGLSLKAFHLVLENIDFSTQTFSIAIFITEPILTTLQFSSEGIKAKRMSTIQRLMAHWYGYSVQDYRGTPPRMKHNIEELFTEVKRRHDNEEVTVKVNVQHEGLRPTLRPYQKRAVRWMLYKEGYGLQKEKEGKMHPLYEEHTTRDGQILYYNRHGGMLVRQKPLAVRSPPGGILADEMGLGKTVEVLACILTHTRTDLPPVEPLPVIKEEPPQEKVQKKPKRPKRKSTSKTDIAVVENESEPQYSEPNISDLNSSLKHDHDYTTTMETTVDNSGDDSSTRGSTSNQGHSYGFSANEESVSAPSANQDRVQISANQEPVSPSLTEPYTYSDSNHSDASVTTGGETSGAKRSGKDNNITDGVAINGAISALGAGAPNSKLNNYEIINDIEGKKNDRKKKESEPEEIKDDSAPTTPTSEFSNSYFECICGEKDLAHKQTMLQVDSFDEEPKSRARKPRRKKGKSRYHVQCEGCGLFQHAGCVNYNLQDPHRGNYKCPHCHVASAPVPSGATLIISPNTISHQWAEEIHKHIHASSIRVFVYQGVQKHGFVQPQTLANHDIVITTYETLRKEIDYVDLPHSNSNSGRSLRYPKRFMAIPSPIIAVEWWRICLDEAQMVECTTTKTAEMALRLSAVNRWCVTGTPIQRSKDDLYGLLLFLGVEPYWVQQWWNTLLYRPYCHGNKLPLFDAIASVLWRTCKKDVLDQICLPKQTEDVHWLTFSPVEEHFYRRQYKNCANDAMKKLSKWRDAAVKLSSLNRDTLHQLLFPLTRLRQACCHPQAVRGEFLPINKSTMTMEELLASLTKKAKLECEEEHRLLVASLNGMAGLNIIRKQYVEAVEMYREVLRSSETHKETFRTDELQLLHTLHNLGEVLALKPEGVAPTLRDDQLTQQAGEIRNKYLQRAAGLATTAEDAWAPVRQNVQELEDQFDDGTDWYLEVLRYAAGYNMDDVLVQKVKTFLEEEIDEKDQTMSHKFRDLRGLQYLLVSQLEDLQLAHDKLIEAVDRLSGKPSIELINKTVVCCLRPADPDRPDKDCPFCKANGMFEEYENKLFLFSDKGISEVVVPEADWFQVKSKRQGSWRDSEMETALKAVLSFGRSNGVSREHLAHAATHMKLLEVLKKEFKLVRQVWMLLKEQVQAYDELDMSVMRLRERLPDEPETEAQQVYIIEPAEYDAQRLKLISDRIIHQNELRKKLGQLLYLKNLAKAQDKMEDGRNPELCPICQKELGTKWSVLTCGHCYCLECIRLMIDKYSIGGRQRSMKCAVCRQLAHISDISYVCTKECRREESDSSLRVRGDHSTKVEGVIKCLLKIRRDDPSAKSLVFSTWWDVLNILEKALQDNNIQYRALGASHKFQGSLTAFKHNEDVHVLLMPLHSGANGLNLIEATHVLLVEPILNPSQELQAIGRVHRIGQTKATYVHRFLVRGTIEERMHHLSETVQAPVNSHRSEETNMTIGDLTALFQELQELTEDDPLVDEHENADASPTGLGSTISSGPSVSQAPRSDSHSADLSPAGLGSTLSAEPIVSDAHGSDTQNEDNAQSTAPSPVSTNSQQPVRNNLQSCSSTQDMSTAHIMGSQLSEELTTGEPSENNVNHCLESRLEKPLLNGAEETNVDILDHSSGVDSILGTPTENTVMESMVVVSDSSTSTHSGVERFPHSVQSTKTLEKNPEEPQPMAPGPST